MNTKIDNTRFNGADVRGASLPNAIYDVSQSRNIDLSGGRDVEGEEVIDIAQCYISYKFPIDFEKIKIYFETPGAQPLNLSCWPIIVSAPHPDAPPQQFKINFLDGTSLDLDEPISRSLSETISRFYYAPEGILALNVPIYNSYRSIRNHGDSNGSPTLLTQEDKITYQNYEMTFDRLQVVLTQKMFEEFEKQGVKIVTSDAGADFEVNYDLGLIGNQKVSFGGFQIPAVILTPKDFVARSLKDIENIFNEQLGIDPNTYPSLHFDSPYTYQIDGHNFADRER